MVRQADTRRAAIIGCGYVGSAVGKALVDAGCRVIGTTTSASRSAELLELGIEPEIVEVSEVDRLRSIVADQHIVYLTIAPRRRDERYRDVYLAGVETLLSAVKGTGVEHLVYTSSTRVYGQDDGGWVDESSPTEPKDENGRVLLDAERLLLSESAVLGLCATVVRLCGIYGPGRDISSHIARYAGTERDDGERYVNLIHIEDIKAALCRLIDAPYHGVLNLSNGMPLRRREYFDRLLADAGLKPIRWVETTGGGGGKRVRNDLIKRTLNLTMRHASP